MHTGDRCNWGAIFCGAVVTMAIGIGFGLAANAFGISPIHLLDERSTDALRIGSGIYAGLTWIAAFFAGGYACARAGRFEDNGSRTLYGFLTWAVAGLFTLILAVQMSLIFRVVLTGEGSDAANWLLLGVAALGMAAAVAGSRMAGRGTRYVQPVVEEPRISGVDESKAA